MDSLCVRHLCAYVYARRCVPVRMLRIVNFAWSAYMAIQALGCRRITLVYFVGVVVLVVVRRRHGRSLVVCCVVHQHGVIYNNLSHRVCACVFILGRCRFCCGV